MYSSLLTCSDFYLNKLKHQRQNDQNRGSVETTGRIFETHDNYVMIHGQNIHKASADMAMGTIFIFPSD